MQGKVIKSTGSWYQVMIDDGSILESRLRGNVRLKNSRSTNPVAVGDNVEIEYEANTQKGVIISIEERKNYIVRKSINLSKKYHVLATNIDLMIVLVTVNNPRTPYGFIDRMLVAAESYRIPVLMLFNKKDTWNIKDKAYAEEVKNTYAKVGYECTDISALDNNDINTVKEFCINKVSLIIGHSGTGKSTLLNGLEPSLNIKTAEISETHQQGKHTTTFAEMHLIAKNTFVIDTPGIREFGIIDMNKQELGHYFPEIRNKMNECKFNNCLHHNEPGCAVKIAVEKNEISHTRYRSYLNMLLDETSEIDYE